jgi:hypothetical protein
MSNVRPHNETTFVMPRKRVLLRSVAWAVLPPVAIALVLLAYYGFPGHKSSQALGWSLAIIYGSYMVWAWGTNRSIQVAATTVAATGSPAARGFALVLGLAQVLLGAFMLIR